MLDGFFTSDSVVSAGFTGDVGVTSVCFRFSCFVDTSCGDWFSLSSVKDKSLKIVINKIKTIKNS